MPVVLIPWRAAPMPGFELARHSRPLPAVLHLLAKLGEVDYTAFNPSHAFLQHLLHVGHNNLGQRIGVRLHLHKSLLLVLQPGLDLLQSLDGLVIWQAGRELNGLLDLILVASLDGLGAGHSQPGTICWISAARRPVNSSSSCNSVCVSEVRLVRASSLNSLTPYKGWSGRLDWASATVAPPPPNASVTAKSMVTSTLIMGCCLFIWIFEN